MSNTPFARSIAAACVLALTASCAALDEHTSLAPWSAGYDAFTSEPGHWVPVATLAVATPLLLLDDQSNSSESIEDQFFNSNTQYGDELAIGLGVTPILLGAFAGVVDGDTRYLEISTETMALTMASTYALKTVVSRERPDGTSQDSFPSAHTSFAFAGATVLAREWETAHDGSWLGYLLYLPASYVGISRLEGGRHYLSDITFGAAIGIFTAHVVYDAHTVEGGFGSGRAPRAAWSAGPVFEERGAGVGFTLSF
jgi:hypothetical protein